MLGVDFCAVFDIKNVNILWQRGALRPDAPEMQKSECNKNKSNNVDERTIGVKVHRVFRPNVCDASRL